MRKITEIKNRYNEYLMIKEGVFGVGEGANEVIVFVQRGKHPHIPTELEGIPVRVIYGERPHALVITV